MTRIRDELERRRLLALIGSGAAVGLAGCGGDGDGGTTTDGDGVPEEYRTATSIGGVERDPSALSTKTAVEYQTDPNDGQQCSNCQFYIEDKNDDGVGACAIVEGTIDPEAYCVSYSAYEGGN